MKNPLVSAATIVASIIFFFVTSYEGFNCYGTESAGKWGTDEYEKAQKRKRDKSILEGKIQAISECPKPQDIDYPNCNLTITVTLNDSSRSTIILVVPCIRASKKIISPEIKKDSLIAFKLIEKDSLTEQEKSIQISDDNPNFDLDYCYADNLEAIPFFSKISVYHKKAMDEIVYDTKLPLTEKDLITRSEYMKKELERVGKIVSSYSVDDGNEFYNRFLKLTAKMGTGKGPFVEIIRDNGLKKIFPVEVNVSPKRFLNAAFLDPDGRTYHNACMIASVNEYLKKRGILLIVVPYPQHFEAFADKFGLSKKLSTYNINKYRYIQYLLQMGVEVLDLEPIFERELKSNRYFHLLLEKNLHQTEMGSYYMAQSLYSHVSKYEFCKNLQQNDYSTQVGFAKYNKQYYEENIKDLERVFLKSFSNPINKKSPFVVVGDSFSTASYIQYYIANAFKTKINVINATSSFTVTPRLIQMRSREISEKTKVLFLINSSYALGDGKIKPFINDEVVIYPNDTIFPNKIFHSVGKDLEKKITIEFDLDISSIVVKSNKYKLFFYISSTKRQCYQLKINSFPVRQVATEHSGHGVIEYPLPEITTPLHVELSTIPEGGYPICIGQNLTLTIDKILLVEE